MSTKQLYTICSMIIFIALIIDDIILMLLALTVVLSSITDAWWRQEIDRKNRFSDKWSFSIQPDFENVAKGNSKTLKCQVFNLPDQTKITNVSWFLNHHGSNQISQLSLNPQKYSSGSNENPWLTIKNFQPDDEGTYRCEIENDVGVKKSASTYLAFTAKPVPVTSPINRECSKNSTQTVRCNVRGNQPKDVQWVKVSKGTAKQVSTCCEKYQGGTIEKPSLSIRNFTIEDEGTYVCNAVNDAGIGSSDGTFLTYILDASDHQNLEDNFHRLVKFVVHIAGDVTKKYFDSCILKADSFENYLEKNIDNILHLHEPHPCCRCSFKCCKCAKACSCKCECKFMLTQDQISILFKHDRFFFNRRHTKGKDGSRQRCTCPYKVKSSVSLSAVDISLLSILLKNVQGVNIPLGVDQKCEDIRKVRNYVFHQSDSQSIVQQEFEKNWKILKESSEFFLHYINDEQYNENFYKNINEIRGSMMIASDRFVQQQIFQEFWRDKCAELEQRHQEEFRLSFSRFAQIIMDEDKLMEKAASEIETLQTVVNKVVIRVFGNNELKKLFNTKDKVTADEGQGTMPVLLQIDVPDYWNEKDITKAFKEIQSSQMNKEVGVKIKSYSFENLNIIIDVLKKIINDIHELHDEVMPLVSEFLSYIDTKEKANVNLKMIAPEKLQLEIGPAKKMVINGYSHTIECNIFGKPSPLIIKWTKKKNREEKDIVPTLDKYFGGTVECPSLTIKCFTIDDEGKYVCRATNEAGVGLSNASQLTYIEKPMVKVSPNRQSVVRGTAQELICAVSGIPQPVVLWMRVNNGEESIINLSPQKYTGGNVDCPSLTIIDFNKKDEGIYVCKATNEAGEGISNNSFLTYIEPPVAIVSPGRQSVVKGKAQTLRCSVSGIPEPLISWMRFNDDGKKTITLSVEKYLGGTVDCPSLTIVDFNKNDEGMYICIATNEAGEALSNSSYLTYIENIPTEDEAFAQDKTPVKYNFPVSVTSRQQINAKIFSNVSYIVDCIKIGNKLVFTDSYRKFMSCNSDGTDVHHISLRHQPGYITEIDSDTVAVSCSGRTILMIKISTNRVISTIKTSNYCLAISYDDNNLYFVDDQSIIHVMDLTGKVHVIRPEPLPSGSIVDITVDRDKMVFINETSIYCCSMDGKLIWKFRNEMYQSLNRVTTDDKDNVYVTDLNTDSVLLVYDDGKRYRILLTIFHGLNRTSGIHFDIKDNVLLVCNYEDGNAFLFDIQNN